jgi:hypothetical protein
MPQSATEVVRRALPRLGAYTEHGELPTRQAYEDTLSVVQRCAGKAVVKVHVGDDCEVLETFADGYFDGFTWALRTSTKRLTASWRSSRKVM